MRLQIHYVGAQEKEIQMDVVALRARYLMGRRVPVYAPRR